MMTNNNIISKDTLMQEKFKQILAVQGTSYRGLAQKIGVELDRLHNIHALSKEELFEIAATLNVPAVWLIENE